MTPLAWEMIKPRYNNNNERGMLLLLLILSAVCFTASLPMSTSREEFPEENGIYLQIEGNVSCPGTYSFPSEVFLYELIEKAEGLSVTKELPSIYKNTSLKNGMKVNMDWDGMKWRISLREISAFNKLTLGIPLSINNESEEGLTALPGIGPKLAKSIVEERMRKDGFRRLSELKNIKGIGERLFERIADQIAL